MRLAMKMSGAKARGPALTSPAYDRCLPAHRNIKIGVKAGLGNPGKLPGAKDEVSGTRRHYAKFSVMRPRSKLSALHG